jgi:hypothetical protein
MTKPQNPAKKPRRNVLALIKRGLIPMPDSVEARRDLLALADAGLVEPVAGTDTYRLTEFGRRLDRDQVSAIVQGVRNRPDTKQ